MHHRSYMGVEWAGLVLWVGGPHVLFWVLPKRSIPKARPTRKRYYAKRVRHWYV